MGYGAMASTKSSTSAHMTGSAWCHKPAEVETRELTFDVFQPNPENLLHDVDHGGLGEGAFVDGDYRSSGLEHEIQDLSLKSMK